MVKWLTMLVLLLPLKAGAYQQTCEVTAYTPHENGSITASGKTPRVGMAAADHLPFGTKIIVHGKMYVIEDRFGGGYTDRIDLFFESHDKAMEFGRQVVVIEVVE